MYSYPIFVEGFPVTGTYSFHTSKKIGIWGRPVRCSIDIIQNNNDKMKQIATVVTNVAEELWDQLLFGRHEIIGTIYDVRHITAFDLFSLLGSEQKAYDLIPYELKNSEFKIMILEQHPYITFDNNRCMTGAQFKERYPDEYVRMFVKDMIHNDFQWKEESINICPDFDVNETCSYGLYAIRKKDWQQWIVYNDKTMYWIADIIIPDRTIVCIENTNGSFKIKMREMYVGKKRRLYHPYVKD